MIIIIIKNFVFRMVRGEMLPAGYKTMRRQRVLRRDPIPSLPPPMQSWVILQ